ncbi:hypothetical protein QGN23_00220 [Chryseobacterium gotjawalense]|uniref:Lipoprotein n=1 Tax=Chryseobacterium gotjawalense TaxID=3042315 RepID=A0ABY8RCN2_9FLAO|nr:hypothetical protein [Chryseobacterium sp. wdc7]WHF51725.1 hypothetical protein QGN23_00220 [Chryseobacterium sp. wdc7]
MKNLFKIILGAGLAITLTSCGTTQNPYGNNYPNNYPNNGSNNGTVYRAGDGQVYRAGDGQVYRRGEVYRDRNGNVYQNGTVIRTGEVYGQPGILGRDGNQTVYYPNQNRRNLPPGQAKKIYGGKATDYAKGQQNKRNNQWKKSDNGDYRDRNYKDYKKGKDHDKKYNKNYKDRKND